MPGAIAEDRYDWTQDWSERNSPSYWSSEDQVQTYLNKPRSVYWRIMRVHLPGPVYL